jgi:thiosulfate/3-mercaptopyruvate sulfurtransferase
MSDQLSNLVSIKWLSQNLDDPELVILDATMKKKPNGEAIAEPSVKVPGAIPFNFDTEICDQNAELPHMLCSAEEFQQAVRNLGISHHSKLVIYDAMGIFSSPRAWWMFKVMGHKNVFVLDGGLPKWVEAGYATDIDYSQATLYGDFSSQFNPEMVFSSQQVLANLNNRQFQILDARSYTRFNAQESEPRQELTAGHIPHSSCLPFTELLIDGFFKSQDALNKIFLSAISSEAIQLVFSCGSGVTACILALGADECGLKNSMVYDGSWSEWGAGNAFPIEK